MKRLFIAASLFIVVPAFADDLVIKEEHEWAGPGWYVISVDEWNSAPLINGEVLPRAKMLDDGPFDSEAVCKTHLPKIPNQKIAEFTSTCERVETKPDCKAPEWQSHCSALEFFRKQD